MPQALQIAQAPEKSYYFGGSHLGSLREQGLISWDHDADLAVFHHSHDFDTIANLAKEQLAKMNYACTQHSTQKFRVAPWNLQLGLLTKSYTKRSESEIVD